MKNKRAKYNAFYNTSLGIEILDDQARECGFYDNVDTPADMALHNYFRSQLDNIGVFDNKHYKTNAIMRKLMELPLMPETKGAAD